MAFRQTVGYRILLMFMSLVCLVGSGYLLYRMTGKSANLEGSLQQAEAAYNQGAEQLKAGNAGQAVQQFDAARTQVESVLTQLDKNRPQGSGNNSPRADEVKALEGKAHYLRARAIRDKYFAQAVVNGKPISDILDSTTGEKYRNFMAIPDDKDRDQAVGSVLQAASILTKDAAVLKDAIRVELTMPAGIDWERLSTLCNVILELDPNDSRATYQLARYDFGQPQKTENGWVDSDPAKRSPERVERSLRATRKARELGGTPPWRLVDLEVLALDWLADQQRRRPKATGPNKADDELRIALFHPTDGALVKAKKSPTLELPTIYDLRGVLDSYVIAAQWAAREANRPSADPKMLIDAVQGFLDIAPKLRESMAGKAYPIVISFALLEAALTAQPVLGARPYPEWSGLFDNYVASVSGSKEQPEQNVGLLKRLSELLTKEISFAGQHGDKMREQKLQQLRKEVQQNAAKLTDNSKASRAELETMHAQALEIHLLNGAGAETMAPHLQFFAALPPATRPGLIFFVEGVLAERQGQVLRARDSLITALQRRDQAAFRFAADVLLFHIFYSTGQHAQALSILKDMEPYYTHPEKLTPIDRHFLPDAPPGLEGVMAARILTLLDLRQQTIRRNKDKPGEQKSIEMTTSEAKMVDAFLKKVKSPSPEDLNVRLALYRIRLLQDRKDQAETELRTLSTEYRDSLPVLATECAWLILPKGVSSESPALPNPEGLQEADQRIQEYCLSHPRHVGARLFRIEWLLQTKRPAEALAFLKDSGDFAEATATELIHLLAHLRGYPLFFPEARPLLDKVRQDASIEMTLFQALADRDAEGATPDPFLFEERRARQSIERAVRELADGRFEDAARSFANVLPVTATRTAAREGLWRTCRSCLAVDPARLRRLVVSLTIEFPDEPNLFFSAALAALMLGDFGQPNDGWERSTSMAAALSRWEPAAKRIGGDPATLALTRAKFWLAANRPSLAQREAARAFALDKVDLGTSVFLAHQALEAGAEDAVKQAQTYWKTAVAIDPDNVSVRCLEAEIKARLGDGPGALRLARSILKDHPRSHQAFAVLVQTCLQRKETAEALACAREWRKVLPSDAAAAREMLQILLSKDQIAEARALAQEFLADCSAEAKRGTDELKPSPAESTALANWERDSQDCRANDRRGAALQVVTVFQKSAQAAEAEAVLHSAIEQDPDAAPLLLLRAEMMIRAGKLKEAWADYERILSKHPRHADAATAAVRLLTTDLNDAKAAFQVVKSFGTANTAEAAFNADIFPRELLYAIGEGYEQLLEGHRVEMRQLLRSAVKRFPNDPQIQLYAGQMLLALDDAAQAIEHLQTSLKLARSKGISLSEEQRRKIIDAAEEALERGRATPLDPGRKA